MNDTTPDQIAFDEVDVHQAHAMSMDGALMLDVREDDEWTAGHAEAATHVPLSSLDPTTIDASATIVAICRSGNRSGKAATQLAAAGHHVVNMTGGMQAWHEAGLPMITDDSRPGALG